MRGWSSDGWILLGMLRSNIAGDGESAPGCDAYASATSSSSSSYSFGVGSSLRGLFPASYQTSFNAPVSFPLSGRLLLVETSTVSRMQYHLNAGL